MKPLQIIFLLLMYRQHGAEFRQRLVLALFLSGGLLFGQDKAAPLKIKADPLVSIQATGGYFFWNAREVYDSMPAVVSDHQKALNQGLRFGGDIMFHLTEGFTLGATYRQIGTAHITERNYWLVPLTDSANKVITDANGNIRYGPKLGTIDESIRMWFFGLRLTKEFELSSTFYLGISLAPGIVNYAENGKFVDYIIETTGSNLAMDIAASGRYQFDSNWSLFLEFALFNGVLSKPFYTDPQQELENYPLNEPISVVNLSVNLGLRFTINSSDFKRNKKKEKRPEPLNPRDMERFQLSE